MAALALAACETRSEQARPLPDAASVVGIADGSAEPAAPALAGDAPSALGGGAAEAGDDGPRDGDDGPRDGDADEVKTVPTAAHLEPLRLDDPCGTPPTPDHVCPHLGSTSDAAAFTASRSALLDGEPATMYRVTLHVRGATEPTHLLGGAPGTPANFVTGGMPYARGSNEANYQYWRIEVEAPAAVYYLNVFNSLPLAHVIEVLDFGVTIPVAAGARVTLALRDENGHEIANDGALHPPGAAAGTQNGQFVQLDVDAVTATPP